ncbi:hypothetical protein LCGC14_3128890, partial [marine sediment metagenome]
DSNCALLEDGTVVGSPGKHPHGRLVPNGLQDASDDPDIIAAWWRQYPQANIGLVTGEQFFVIDCDKHEDIDGTARFLQISHEHNEDGIEVTATADTGGGGAHFCFAMDDAVSVRNQQGMMINGERVIGIDVRGEGGYIVAPPSIHASGRPYVWAWNLFEHLKAAPAWLLTLVASVTGNVSSNNVTEFLALTQPTRAAPPLGRDVNDVEVEQVKEALRLMPPNTDRTTWIERITMPLHDLFGGSENGFHIWHEWCSMGDGLTTPNGKPAYDGPKACRKIWDSFRAAHRNPKGPATFWQFAYECGWRAPNSVSDNGQPASWPTPDITTTQTFDPEELAQSFS